MSEITPMHAETSEFEAILSGKKRFVDVAGCDWKTGDVVRILEVDDTTGGFTGRSLTRKVKLHGTGIPFGMTFRVTIVELIE